MPESRVTTIRQAVDQAEALEVVARIDGEPVSEAIRKAIAKHIEARRGDPEFQARLRHRLEADEEIIRRLAE
jgi:hypothetical protein